MGRKEGGGGYTQELLSTGGGTYTLWSKPRHISIFPATVADLLQFATKYNKYTVISRRNNVLNCKCRSLSNCGTSKTVVDKVWLLGDYLRGGGGVTMHGGTIYGGMTMHGGTIYDWCIT